ncbi:substrate-binding periplasmic protein [Parachitinimonas caeni]|uniref:Transporter substrate-binding domain-containing protein n=1 Tax=Parachitinimonas caeni TaxID=3031301 RepID=A0ABT7E0M7_9NEIS|nr:transporter substrate-binding domain-containing protein [Parachitinimonas caeni]MDK2125604.1 transporter substrate-binding domain-containing protein [Parachitinimonas caeni]
MTKCLIAVLLSGSVVFAHAEVRLVAGEVPPFVYRDNGVEKGVAYDLFKEMAKRVGHSGKIEMVPFVRAIEMGKTEPNMLLIPIGRNEAREKSYGWVTGLVEEEFLLFAASNSKVDISSFEAAKDLRIGVMRASVGERIAKEKGLAKIEDVTQEDVNAKKLAGGRIDAWIGARNSVMQGQKVAGLDRKLLRSGAVGSRINIFLASSLNFDAAEAAKWKGALEAIKKDGTYARILKNYEYDLPD